jgi:hypothetical protein
MILATSETQARDDARSDEFISLQGRERGKIDTIRKGDAIYPMTENGSKSVQHREQIRITTTEIHANDDARRSNESMCL